MATVTVTFREQYARARETAPLDELLDAYTAACEVSKRLWAACGDIEEASPVALPRVQVGRLLLGKNDDGTDIFEPIYAYSADAVARKIEPHRAGMLAMWGRGDSERAIAETMRINEKYDRLIAGKVTDLQRQQAEVEAIQQACGYTDAFRVARDASNTVDATVQAILTHEFRSVADVCRAARFLIEGEANDRDGIFSEEIVGFVKQLAERAI